MEPVSGIRRVCLALASDGGGLEALVALLSAGGALDRVLWNEAEPGLQAGVLPPGVDEPRSLADLVEAAHRAQTALRAADPGRAPALLVLHEGLVRLVDGQFDGPALDTVRTLGRVRPPEDFGVVLSRRVFEDLAALDVQPLPLARFRPLTVDGVDALVAGWPVTSDGGRPAR